MSKDVVEGYGGVAVNEDNMRVAVAIRAARAALGLSQQELADALGIPKSSLARIETLEALPKTDVYFRVIRFFKNIGIDVDPISTEGVAILVTPKSLEEAMRLLKDVSRRRSDRFSTGA